MTIAVRSARRSPEERTGKRAWMGVLAAAVALPVAGAVAARIAAACGLRGQGADLPWLASTSLAAAAMAVASAAVFWRAGLRGNPWFGAPAPSSG